MNGRRNKRSFSSFLFCICHKLSHYWCKWHLGFLFGFGNIYELQLIELLNSQLHPPTSYPTSTQKIPFIFFHISLMLNEILLLNDLKREKWYSRNIALSGITQMLRTHWFWSIFPSSLIKLLFTNSVSFTNRKVSWLGVANSAWPTYSANSPLPTCHGQFTVDNLLQDKS